MPVLKKKKHKSGSGLPAPSALTANPASDTSILLNWVDNSIGETGFRIEMSIDNITYSSFQTVGAGITTYTWTGLTPTLNYFFRVKALPASAYSNVANNATYDSDAWTAISAMSVDSDPDDPGYINTVFLAMKDASVWNGPSATCVAFYGMSPVSESASLFDWVSLSEMTNFGLSWSSSGFEIDSLNWINTGIKLDILGASTLSIGNFIIIIRYATQFSGDGVIMGAIETGVAEYSMGTKISGPDTLSYGKVQSSTSISSANYIDAPSSYLYAIGAGPWTEGPVTWGVHIDRKDQQVSNVTTPSAFPSYELFLGALNDNGSPSFGTEIGTVTGIFIFTDMSAVDLYDYTELIKPIIEAYNGNYGR